MSGRVTSGVALTLLAGALGALMVAGCAPGTQATSATVVASPAPGTSAAAQTPERPLAPEVNPVGDIPDTQAFVTYTASPGGYTLEVPEGWARTANGSGVRFVDKFDGVSVSVATAAAAPMAASAKQNEVPAIVKAGHAVQVSDVQDVKLPSGPAVRITATANSDPDPVTNKQVRLEEQIFLLYHNGTLATLQLWAPQGADNVDQWQRMVNSFSWQ